MLYYSNICMIPHDDKMQCPYGWSSTLINSPAVQHHFNNITLLSCNKLGPSYCTSACVHEQKQNNTAIDCVWTARLQVSNPASHIKQMVQLACLRRDLILADSSVNDVLAGWRSTASAPQPLMASDHLLPYMHLQRKLTWHVGCDHPHSQGSRWPQQRAAHLGHVTLEPQQ